MKRYSCVWTCFCLLEIAQVLKAMTDLNEVSEDLVQIASLFSVTEKSSVSKFFIFNAALISLCRACVENQYWRDLHTEDNGHHPFFVDRLWGGEGLTAARQGLFGINAEVEAMSPKSFGSFETQMGTEPKYPKLQSSVLILNHFFLSKLKFPWLLFLLSGLSKDLNVT